MRASIARSHDRRAGWPVARGATLDNLKLQISTSDIARWQEWMQSFLISGQDTNDHELTGRIDLLGEDLQPAFFSIELQGVGLVSLTMPVLDGGA